jgi:hypothetical protein
MPNWVYNKLTLTGAKPDIDHIEAELASDSECISFEKVTPRPPAEDSNWYEWNIANWGTKWDAGDTEVTRTDADKAEVLYRFNTAWSAPLPIFEALAAKYPTLEIRLHFEEEQGWGGEVFAHNGNLELVRQWDIPRSHAELVERGEGCFCDNCDLDSNIQFMYEDCGTYVLSRLGTELDDKTKHAFNSLHHEWEGTLGDLIKACDRLVAESAP